MSQPRASVRRRLVAVVVGPLLALVAGEAFVRLRFPSSEQTATRIVADDGEVFPVTDVIPYMAKRFAGDPGASRAFRSVLCYSRPEWDYFDEDGCVEIVCNTLGLRDDEIGAKEDGELRILALGDSVTFGLGVRGEDAWPNVLERRLAHDDPERPVEVVNCGFAGAGYWPPGYRDWLRDVGVTLDPDVVIVGLCLNDMNTAVPMAMLSRGVRDPWLGGVSRLLVMVQEHRARVAFDRELAAVPEERSRKLSRAMLAKDDQWERSSAALADIQALCAARGIRLLVAVFPMMSQLATSYPFHGLHEAALAFCEEAGIETVDLRAPLIEYARAKPGFQDRELWVHPTDQHPNPVALEMFATGIRAALGDV